MKCPRCKRFAKEDFREHNTIIGFCERCSITIKNELSGHLTESDMYCVTCFASSIPWKYTYRERQYL